MRFFFLLLITLIPLTSFAGGFDGPLRGLNKKCMLNKVTKATDEAVAEQGAFLCDLNTALSAISDNGKRANQETVSYAEDVTDCYLDSIANISSPMAGALVIAGCSNTVASTDYLKERLRELSYRQLDELQTYSKCLSNYIKRFQTDVGAKIFVKFCTDKFPEGQKVFLQHGEVALLHSLKLDELSAYWPKGEVSKQVESLFDFKKLNEYASDTL